MGAESGSGAGYTGAGMVGDGQLCPGWRMGKGISVHSGFEVAPAGGSQGFRGCRTISTEHGARAASADETLPMMSRSNAPMPLAPVKMQCAFISVAAVMRASFGTPSRIENEALKPAVPRRDTMFSSMTF